MCTIIGLKLGNITENEKQKIIDYLDKYITYRGRDSFGIFIYPKMIYKDFNEGKFKKILFGNIQQNTQILIQARAIPETETEDILENIQPIEYGNIYLLHNGLIYNDKELKEKYNIDDYDETKMVDSYVIAALLNKLNEKQTMEELKGSYSCIYLKDGQMRYMVNYQPLYVIKDNNFIIVSNIPYGCCNHIKACEIEPYSYGLIE